MIVAFARRLALALFVLSVVTAAFGQPPTALRTDLGAMLGNGPDGAPRYREDSGWNDSNFAQPQWAAEYGVELNGRNPWTAVLQAGRTNSGLTAAANKLTLDLGGQTYTVRPSGGVGGQVVVVDRDGTGAYLRLTNGTLNNEGGSAYKTLIGADGVTGRLFIEGATLRTGSAYVGNGSGASSGASGELIVGSGGNMSAFDTIYVGRGGTGALTLQGANSFVTAKNIWLGDLDGTGSVVLADPTAVLRTVAEVNDLGQRFDGNLTITNPVGSGPGLRVDGGTVDIGGNLILPLDSSKQGSVQINGGTVRVAGTVFVGSNSGATNGGRVFLHGGRFEIASPGSMVLGNTATAAQRKFYWRDGTLAFTNSDVTLSATQLQTYTAQGEASYGGERGAGKVATGQTLDAAGTLRFNNGAIQLSGGTIRAATGVVVDGSGGNPGSVSGYGTIDAVVSGNGAVAGTGSHRLAIGALGGANAVTSEGGELRVGHLGVDSTHVGTVTAGGQFVKVGGGTQTLRGQFGANDGVRVESGRLVFDGNSATTSPLRVSSEATARFQNGATGTVTSVTVSGASTPDDAGRLQIDGASTRVTARTVVVNNGWVELTNGGMLTVGSDANPGQFVNAGHLINGGTLNAVVTGAGKISGSGTFSGAVTIGSGAMLAPGHSPGTANFNDLTLGPGGNFELELANAAGTAGVNWDLAAVAGALAVTATAGDPFTIAVKSLTAGLAPGVLAGFDPSRVFSWKFVSVADPSKLTGFDPSQFEFDMSDFVAYNSLDGGTFNVTAAQDGLYVNFAPQPAAVPEPGSLVLLSVTGLAAAGWRARRKLRRRAMSTAA